MGAFTLGRTGNVGDEAGRGTSSLSLSRFASPSVMSERDARYVGSKEWHGTASRASENERLSRLVHRRRVLDLIAQGQGPSPVTRRRVLFTTCAHTAWHRHSLGQTPYATEGEGFVQARGGPLIMIRPGDIVVTPPNEWQWHGATVERFMVHFAFTEGDTEWADHLTDDEYPPTDLSAGPS